MSTNYDIERTKQGLDINEASARIDELEAAMHEIRGLATMQGTKVRGLIYATATKMVFPNGATAILLGANQ